jgi:glycosyltransferase involved in cell wall biosynthesis
VKVCLDARKLYDSGIGTYIRGVLEGAVGLEAAPQWNFILKAGEMLPPSLAAPAVRLQYSAAKNYSLGEIFTLARLGNRSRADLYHAPHYVIPMGLKLPLVVTVHDLIHLAMPQYFSSLQRAYARWMLGRVGKSAAQVITVSQYSRQDLIHRLGFPPDKIAVTYSGVSRRYFQDIPEDQLFQFRSDYGLPPEYLLYIGNLKPHKNVSGLIEAWNRLPDSVRPALVILGTRTDQYLRLRYRTAELGREKEIFFLSDLPSEVMPHLHRGAAAYVQPSWYEGFGSPPLEAMACSRPTAVSNRTALPEITGGAALIFDPGKPEEMTSALLRLLTDTTLREDLSTRGPQRAQEFDWAVIAARTLDVYCHALEKTAH